MPTKTPSTDWLSLSAMKLRNTRGLYWVAADESTTSVIEKITPATVIIEPAIAVSMARAPSVPAPNSPGQRCISMDANRRSSWIRATASAVAPVTMMPGISQRLVRNRCQAAASREGLFFQESRSIASGGFVRWRARMRTSDHVNRRHRHRRPTHWSARGR